MYALRQEQTKFTAPKNQSPLIDPALIRAAGQIYYIHCEVHPEIAGQPSGVAINHITHRGKVIFTQQPVTFTARMFCPIKSN